MWSAYILTPMGCYSKCLCGLLLKPSECLSFPAHFSREFHGLLCENLCLFLILSLFSESVLVSLGLVSAQTAVCWSCLSVLHFLLYPVPPRFSLLQTKESLPGNCSILLIILFDHPWTSSNSIIFSEVKRPAFHYSWSGWTMVLCRAINFLPHFLVWKQNTSFAMPLKISNKDVKFLMKCLS